MLYILLITSPWWAHLADSSNLCCEASCPPCATRLLLSTRLLASAQQRCRLTASPAGNDMQQLYAPPPATTAAITKGAGTCKEVYYPAPDLTGCFETCRSRIMQPSELRVCWSLQQRLVLLLVSTASMTITHLHCIATPAKPQLLPGSLQFCPLPVLMHQLAPAHGAEL
jgi:hypothetical protein